MASALIRDVRVLDGRGLREGRQDVEIRDGRLHDVRPHRQAAPAPDIPAFDGEGMYLLPGLIDLHVHLVWDGSPDPVEQLRKESTERTLLRAVRHARETLEAGITTVRDLGSIDDLAVDLSRAVERGDVVGPRIVPSGRTIIMTGGHDPFWGIMVDGPQEALKAARHQIYRGAGVIKVSATGGVYGRTEGESATHTELNPDEICAVTREAHKLGVPVAAHAIGREGIRNCVKAGVDTIEHGQQLTPDLAAELAAYGGSPGSHPLRLQTDRRETGDPGVRACQSESLTLRAQGSDRGRQVGGRPDRGRVRRRLPAHSPRLPDRRAPGLRGRRVYAPRGAEMRHGQGRSDPRPRRQSREHRAWPPRRPDVGLRRPAGGRSLPPQCAAHLEGGPAHVSSGRRAHGMETRPRHVNPRAVFGLRA